jgi:RIO-like serine/threonine protein kinase
MLYKKFNALPKYPTYAPKFYGNIICVVDGTQYGLIILQRLALTLKNGLKTHRQKILSNKRNILDGLFIILYQFQKDTKFVYTDFHPDNVMLNEDCTEMFLIDFSRFATFENWKKSQYFKSVEQQVAEFASYIK